jgi:hypothetical protein
MKLNRHTVNKGVYYIYIMDATLPTTTICGPQVSHFQKYNLKKYPIKNFKECCSPNLLPFCYYSFFLVAVETFLTGTLSRFCQVYFAIVVLQFFSSSKATFLDKYRFSC